MTIEWDGGAEPLASNSGWSAFGDWADSLDADEFRQVVHLWEHGHVRDVGGLAAELDAALSDRPPPDSHTHETAENLLRVAHAATHSDHLAVTDGTGPESGGDEWDEEAGDFDGPEPPADDAQGDSATDNSPSDGPLQSSEDPDPLALLSGAMLAHAEESLAAGDDPAPGLERLRGLADDPAALAEVLAAGGADAETVGKCWLSLVRKSWSEEDHPRGKGGVFISKDKLEAAKDDPKVAAKLRKEVRPEDAGKLEKVISGEKSPGRTKRGQAAHEAAGRRTTREEGKAKTAALLSHLKRVGDLKAKLTADHLHDLADHLQSGHPTVEDVRAMRKALAGAGQGLASFGGAKRKEAMVAALVAHAKGKAFDARVKEQGFDPEEMRAALAPTPEPAAAGAEPPAVEPTLQELETGVRPGGGRRAQHADPMSRPYRREETPEPEPDIETPAPKPARPAGADDARPTADEFAAASTPAGRVAPKTATAVDATEVHERAGDFTRTRNSEVNAAARAIAAMSQAEAKRLFGPGRSGKDHRRDAVAAMLDRRQMAFRGIRDSGGTARDKGREHRRAEEAGLLDEPMVTADELFGPAAPPPAKRPAAANPAPPAKVPAEPGPPAEPPATDLGRRMAALYNDAPAGSVADLTTLPTAADVAALPAAERRRIAAAIGVAGADPGRLARAVYDRHGVAHRAAPERDSPAKPARAAKPKAPPARPAWVAADPAASAALDAHAAAPGRARDVIGNALANAGLYDADRDGNPTGPAAEPPESDSGRTPAQELAGALAAGHRDQHDLGHSDEEREATASLLRELGAVQVGEVGESARFDGAVHDGPPGAFTGHALTVTRPGWKVPLGGGRWWVPVKARLAKNPPTNVATGLPAAPSRFGQAGDDHPLAALPDRRAKLDALSDIIGRMDGSADPSRIGDPSVPPPHFSDALRDDILGVMARKQAEISVPADIAETYAAVGAKHGLTKHDFQRVLAHMDDRGDLRLQDWPRSVDDVPDPEMPFALPGDSSQALRYNVRLPANSIADIELMARLGDQSLRAASPK